MLRTVLVPLDGSAFSEQALPVAMRIAALTQARIELVHVYEHPLTAVYGGRAAVRDPRTEEELRARHETYLPGLARRLRSQTDVPVDFTMPEGQVVRRLVELSERPDVQIVVMTTHGRSGIGRMWLGSVADAVVRGSAVPVLLVRRPGVQDAAPVAEFRRVFIPLDGSMAAEEALDHAMIVTGGTAAQYRLFQVVAPYEPPAVGELGVASAVGSPGAADAALEYLAVVEETARSRGLDVSSEVVTARQPARAIVTAAGAWNADLIAMTTHGRTGVDRLLLGSVAEKVVHAVHLPVLVVRPAFERATDDIEDDKDATQDWALTPRA